MTKMKSKKMTKSTFAIIIMAIVMVAMLAFGGTYAYFSATTEDAEGRVKTGTVNLNNTSFTSVVNTDLVVPGMKLINSPISVTNASDVNTWIFVTIDLGAKKFKTGDTDVYTGDTVTWTFETGHESEKAYDPTISSDVAWKNNDGANGADYDKLPDGVYAYKATSSETSLEFVEAISLNEYVKSQSTNGTAGDLMNVQITITVTAKSIQAFKDYSGENGAAAEFTAEEAWVALGEELKA